MRYSQIVILPACDFKLDKDKAYFYEFFKKYKFRKPKIIGVVETLPNKDANGKNIPGTGGRKDLFFYINEKDEKRFCTWKYTYSMLYWEDVFYNNEQELYPKKFRDNYPPNM